MSKEPEIVQVVAEYCWSDRFLSIFRNFFREHAHLFADSDSGKVDEHELSYYDIFQEYLRLYERTIENFIRDTGYTVEEFYQELKQVQQRGENADDLHFVECLLTSADYESFYRVMTREARRQARAKESQSHRK